MLEMHHAGNEEPPNSVVRVRFQNVTMYYDTQLKISQKIFKGLGLPGPNVSVPGWKNSSFDPTQGAIAHTH